VAVTPLERAPAELAAGRDLWLKREDAHELGAFKWRGALPTLERWRSDVVTASTGNHGAATAWAAQRLGLRAVVFVPENAPASKLAILDRLGADLRHTAGDLDDAKDAARAFAAGEGLPFFEDGAEPSQYEGYAAIGEEILERLEPAAVLVPVGNGALLAGIGRVLRPPVRRIAVAAAEAPVMAESWRAGRPVESSRSATRPTTSCSSPSVSSPRRSRPTRGPGCASSPPAPRRSPRCPRSRSTGRSS
jgi:threonine dehydratase